MRTTPETKRQWLTTKFMRWLVLGCVTAFDRLRFEQRSNDSNLHP